MIRPCFQNEIQVIYKIINDAAHAYSGHIPADCYHDPYMSLDELTQEIGRAHV
jgi:hypothetical protein